MNSWPDLSLPVIFAHRGASLCAPENTLSAFRCAADCGSPAVELDVKLTLDGEVVVFHDQRVERTTDGHGCVHELPWSVIRKMDAGGWFDARFKGERIPLLSEVFEACGKDLYFNVELTNYATPNDDLVMRVAKIIKQHGMEERVLLSSFLPDDLFHAQTIMPEVPRGLLISALGKGRRARIKEWQNDAYQAVHPSWMVTGGGFIRQVHANQQRIHVWTVDLSIAMRFYINQAVDGIITNDPEKAGRILRTRS